MHTTATLILDHHSWEVYLTLAISALIFLAPRRHVTIARRIVQGLVVPWFVMGAALLWAACVLYPPLS